MSEPQPTQTGIGNCTLADIFAAEPRLNATDRALVQKAYDFADNAHKDEIRYSGEPYLVHLCHTARNLAKLQMDAEVISAGLLHDSIDNAKITEEQLSKIFGPDIAFLVEGVTKLGQLKYQGSDRQAENLRKLFVAMAKDIRVIIVKFADRLHNVRTLEFVKPEKRKRIAIETLEIYAPLADRLGMGKLREQLERSSFPHAYPAEFEMVKRLRKDRIGIDTEYLEKTYRHLQKELASRGIKDADISYREKELYSLYKKLLRSEKNLDISKINDIYAIRVIVPTLENSYQVLGIVHGMWRPVPERLKDYIALPKLNGYQSIHTSVFTGDGHVVEIQIRTKEMHKEAEFGIAAHIAYTESGKPRTGGILSKKLAWVRQLID